MKRIVRKLRFFFIAIALIFSGIINLQAQCTVQAYANRDSLVCGYCAQLSAFGRGQGLIVFSENFNNGVFGPGWQSSQQAMWNNPCSPNGVDGTTHIWLGNSSPVPRILMTQSYNLSTATAGVTICFDMKFAIQGDAAPCEGPDEPDEGVALQYSVNGGTTWVEIHYFDPNGGNDETLINWTEWCFELPPAAIASNTMIRWFQDNDSGADYDHWGIDNVQIYFNDPTYQIVWLHDGYNQGATGGINPNLFCPRNDTTIILQMTNGTSYCYDTLHFTVRDPFIIANISSDTTICINDCAQLSGDAKIIISPAKTPTYSNNEFQVITSGMGQVTSININVTNLNMETVLPNSIVSVCINNLTYFGQSLLPPAQIGIEGLKVSLQAPSGQVIILVPAGVTAGSPTLGYSNTCFVPTGAAINSGSAPYSGNFAPNQPFSTLVGAVSNGLWVMKIEMASSLGFGNGTFSGWKITFDDPEISYPGAYVWSPTTNMTGFNSLNPTVCPTQTGNYSYFLSVKDSANCATYLDSVHVSVTNCCNFSYSANVQNTTCGRNNGSIDLTVTPAGTFTYAWSNGATTQSINNVGPGSYHVTITQPSTDCTMDTVIVVPNVGSYPTAFTGSTQSDFYTPTGSAWVSATSAGNYSYVWNTTPASTDTLISNVNAGTYSVTITDNSSACTSVFTVVVPSSLQPIVIPNILTPNNDGYNDTFIIQFIDQYPNSQLVVRNRWGKKVFSSDDYKNDWNGNGAADGVYYYILKLSDGKEYSGSVTLMK